MPTAPLAGQVVTVRDETWIVLRTESFEQVSLVSLRGLSDRNRGEVRALLAPFDRFERPAAFARLRARPRRTVIATAAAAVAEALPWGEPWTAAAAAIDLRPWQLEPARAALGGAMRLLLADHVGLGKTIQAGLVLAELLARGLARRALVLTPASLRRQWQAELRDRLRLHADVMDQDALCAAVATLPAGANPWAASPLIISSIDLVKRPEVRTAVEGVPFDVLVVDEAHHAAPGTDRGAVVAHLAARASWVVLATATPHSGDDGAFAFLQGLGELRARGLRVFRRSRDDVHPRTAGKSVLFAVRPTDAERRLLRETTQYVRQVRREGRSRPGAALVASVIARRAASSGAAAHVTLARRLALLRGAPSAEPQPALPWDEHDDRDLGAGDAELARPALSDAAREIVRLERLVRLAAQASARSSKLETVRRLLRRSSEAAVVFSEFRDIALQAAAYLSASTTVAVLHGGLSPRDRDRAVHDFTAGRARVLVATDAAGEGLNLHARCRLVINIELPWSPRRVAQRVGRVDRLGQTRRVHALHLVHRQSFEGTVIARLERRRAQAARRVPHEPPREARADALVVSRRLVQARGAHEHTSIPGGVYARDRAGVRSRSARLVLLFTARVIDRSGRVLQNVCVPVVVQRAPTRAGRSQLSSRMLREIGGTAGVRGVVRQTVDEHVQAARSAVEALSRGWIDRIDAMLDALDRDASARAWQASLFDRRAEQRASRAAATRLALRAHLERQRTSAEALEHVETTGPALLAAWPVW